MAERIAYSAKELTEACGIGMTTLYEEIKAGRLVRHKLGTRTIFLVDDVNAWLHNLPIVPAGFRSPSQAAGK